MKYDVILCDADGVIVKAGPYLFSEQLSHDYGIPVDKMLPFFKGAFALCSLGQADLKQELKKVIDEWGWRGTVDELLEYWLTKGTQFDEQTIDYLKWLKDSGARCFITSDNEKYRAEFLKAKLGDGKPCEDVFYSAELGVNKHDPTFFQRVYEALGKVPKTRVLFIDDDNKNVRVARDFGFDTHLYTNLQDLKNFLA